MVAEFAETFAPMSGLVARKIGYGLGTRDNRTRPNVLRAVLADPAGTDADGHDWETDTIAVLETNLDDVSGEVLGHFIGTTLDDEAVEKDRDVAAQKRHGGRHKFQIIQFLGH